MKDIVEREISNELLKQLSIESIKVVGFAEVGAQGDSQYVLLLSDNGSRVFRDEGHFWVMHNGERYGSGVNIEDVYKVVPFLKDFLGNSIESTKRGHFKFEKGEWIHLDAIFGNHLFIRSGMIKEFIERFEKIPNAFLAHEGIEVAINMLRGTQSAADRDGSIIGAIVGDIAGSRFEFHNRKTKEFSLLVSRGEEERHCYFTDDTVMTLAVAQAIIDWRTNGSGDRTDLSAAAVSRMQEFGRRYPHAGYGGAFRRWLEASRPQPYNSWGNGSAMRVSACGWAGRTLDEVKAMSCAVTEVTHNHPEGIKGAEATAVCVFLARQGKSKDEIKAYVSEHYYPLDFTLDDIRAGYSFDVSCQGSVPQALEAFFESTSFEDAIRNAISIGGDSDTIGAICGAAAEAFYGVPDEIRAKAMTFLPRHLLGVLERAESVFG